MKIKRNFAPCPSFEKEEIFRNGIFDFNISRILEDIHSGRLPVEKEDILIQEWCKSHGHHSSLNEDHLTTVDIDKTIIQAEIRPGFFTIINGNHRIEKAYWLGKSAISSYKLIGEQLIRHFITTHGCQAFMEYWNSKLFLKSFSTPMFILMRDLFRLRCRSTKNNYKDIWIFTRHI